MGGTQSLESGYLVFGERILGTSALGGEQDDSEQCAHKIQTPLLSTPSHVLHQYLVFNPLKIRDAHRPVLRLQREIELLLQRGEDRRLFIGSRRNAYECATRRNRRRR